MREQIANPVPKRASAQYPLANPHRAGHQSGIHPEDQPYQSTELEEDDRYYQVRTSSCARRYQTTEGNQVIEQGNRRLVIHNEPLPKPRKKSHWPLFVRLGMLGMVTIWGGLSQLANWWSNHQLDSTYGFPRTYQADQAVGFHDSQTPTHFIALNLNGQVEVIVCPASNCTKAIVYPVILLYGESAAALPVTVSFEDIAHNGKLDMIVHVGDQQFIYLNDGTQFKLQQ